MKRERSLLWLWQVTGKAKGYILALTALQGAGGVIGVIYALLFRAMVDFAVAGDAAGFQGSAVRLAGLVLVQLLVSALTRWLHELAKADIENRFKRRLLDKLLHKDFASVSSKHTGEWLNRLTSDTAVVAGGTVEILPGLVGTVIRMVSALGMILALNPTLGWVLIPGCLAMGVFSYLFRDGLKQLHKEIRERDGLLRVLLQERLANLLVIKAFSAEGQTGEAAEKAMAAHKAARLRRNRFSNVASTGLGAAMEGMYLLGAVFCAHGILTGHISYGTLAAVMQLVGQLQRPFANLSGFVPRWFAMTASAERLMEIEDEADDGQAADWLTMRRYYAREFQVLGLRNASFAYPASPGAEAPTVLEGLSLELRKGETVAFTGPSGCGKTTVLKLLMCMYSLKSGERFLDAQDLTAAHRRLFAYVPQGNALMNGSIRDAVCFAADRDDARLKRALTIACADEFVDDVERELGERGAGLSEGQMQRLAIARAIYTDAPILLLDEATSALDAATEQKLLDNLRRLTDKTVVIVTHRTAALSICDRVLHFSENGVEAV